MGLKSGHYGKIESLIMEGRLKKARSLLKRLLENEPASTRALILSARIEELSGNREGAMAFYEKVLKIDPNHPVASRSYSMCLKNGDGIFDRKVLKFPLRTGRGGEGHPLFPQSGMEVKEELGVEDSGTKGGFWTRKREGVVPPDSEEPSTFVGNPILSGIRRSIRGIRIRARTALKSMGKRYSRYFPLPYFVISISLFLILLLIMILR